MLINGNEVEAGGIKPMEPKEMNMHKYALSRGRNYDTVRKLCDRHKIGTKRLVNGIYETILDEDDMKNLDGRKRQ